MEKINKDGEEYYVIRCANCNKEIKCATKGRKYCFDCKKLSTRLKNAKKNK